MLKIQTEARAEDLWKKKQTFFLEIDFKFNVKSFKMKKIGSQKIYFSFY